MAYDLTITIFVHHVSGLVHSYSERTLKFADGSAQDIVYTLDHTIEFEECAGDDLDVDPKLNAMRVTFSNIYLGYDPNESILRFRQESKVSPEEGKHYADREGGGEVGESLSGVTGRGQSAPQRPLIRKFLLTYQEKRFKTTKICFGSTIMEIFYWEKAFHFMLGKKSDKMALPPPPSEKFSCYAPGTTSDRENFADPTGKGRQGKKGNWRRKEGKLKQGRWKI